MLGAKLLSLAKQYPVVTLTGPRQSGKTTLVRICFKDKSYVSLEDPDMREFALSDPRGFLGQFKDGAVIDEVQRAPDLLSYIQGVVDSSKKSSMFILTGSQQFLLLDRVSQSLAGRTALLSLLPLSLQELRKNRLTPENLDALLLSGGYPSIYDRGLNPWEWNANYVATYLERDVRSIKNIGDLSLFQRFLSLCAARSGHLLNYSEIGNACGITHNTVRSWISVLEASYIVFLTRPHHGNFSKRLVKTPKLYFHDTGLLCYLLGLRDRNALSLSPFRGHIFETLIMGEIVKHFMNRGDRPAISFWRDKTGNEIDCMIDFNNSIVPVEIKSGATILPDYFSGLAYWKKISGSHSKGYVVYGGDTGQKRSDAEVVPWMDMDSFLKTL